MAMLIAWQALNKLANPQDAGSPTPSSSSRPGITIRDRLRVLLPERPGQLLPRARHRPARPPRASWARRRSSSPTSTPSSSARRGDAAKLTKAILEPAGTATPSPFTETPDEMVSRVCRELGGKKHIVVINDEAHHCYRRKADGEAGEADGRGARRGEAPRGGGPALDLRAGGGPAQDRHAASTTCPPRRSSCSGSGYPEGTLFPWVVSDFSLIDAIECRHRQDSARAGRRRLDGRASTPTYRDLWLRIREDLPKKGRKTEDARRRAEAAGGAGRRAAEPVRQLREVVPTAGSRTPRPRAARPHAAGVHRRLQQHQRLEAGLRLRSPAGRRKHQRRRRDGRRARQAARCSATWSTAAGATGRTRSWSIQQQLESGEAHERRVQEDRRQPRSTSSRPSTARGSPAATPRT